MCCVKEREDNIPSLLQNSDVLLWKTALNPKYHPILWEAWGLRGSGELAIQLDRSHQEGARLGPASADPGELDAL